MSEEWIKKYVIRDRSAWAAIMVDSAGMLAVVSSYGNWAYHWYSFGNDFKAFLGSIDSSYLVGKLTQGQRKFYDAETTLKTVKEAICRYRREGSLSKEAAREEWDGLADHNDLYYSEDFSSWLMETNLMDAYEYHRSTRDPQCIMFSESLWPVFIEELKKNPPQPLAAA